MDVLIDETFIFHVSGADTGISRNVMIGFGSVFLKGFYYSMLNEV